MAEYKESKELIAEIGVIISRIKRNPYDSKDETKGTLCGLAHAIECIKSHPTADVVSVVRCKDCKHFITDTFKRTMCNRTFTMFEMQPEDYCSYGERKN